MELSAAVDSAPRRFFGFECFQIVDEISELAVEAIEAALTSLVNDPVMALLTQSVPSDLLSERINMQKENIEQVLNDQIDLFEQQLLSNVFHVPDDLSAKLTKLPSESVMNLELELNAGRRKLLAMKLVKQQLQLDVKFKRIRQEYSQQQTQLNPSLNHEHDEEYRNAIETYQQLQKVQQSASQFDKSIMAMHKLYVESNGTGSQSVQMDVDPAVDTERESYENVDVNALSNFLNQLT